MTARKPAKKPAPSTKKATSKAATKKQAGTAAPADWERIELDYRAGIKTLRQIAGENGISHTLVARRAKREDWARDLSAKINAKADELVSKAGVSKPVTPETRLAERQIVDANAQAAAAIRLAHRKDIHRNRAIVASLMDELERQIGPDAIALLDQLGEMMRSPDDAGADRLNDLYRKIISLPERAKTAKTLAETLRIAVDMERQAFNMDAKDKPSDDDPLTALLHRLANGNGNAIKPVAIDPEAPHQNYGAASTGPRLASDEG